MKFTIVTLREKCAESAEFPTLAEHRLFVLGSIWRFHSPYRNFIVFTSRGFPYLDSAVSNHLSDLEEEGVIQRYPPVVDYDAVGYDVTAVMQLKAEGDALLEIADTLKDHDQMTSVYEVTGDYDIIAIGKFKDTEDMNDQIKSLITDPDINQSNTNIVLNAVAENEQFELNADASDL